MQPSDTLAPTTASDPQTKEPNDDALQALGDFLVQAVASTLTSFYRTRQEGLIPHDLPNAQWKRMVTLQFLQYLNDCWMSLMLRDDNDNDDSSVVTVTLARIGHDSPVCVFHIMAMVGQAMIPDADFRVTTTDHPNDDVAAYRKLAHAHARQEFQQTQPHWSDVLYHNNCKGQSLETLRQHVRPLFSIGQYEPPTDGDDQKSINETKK